MHGIIISENEVMILKESQEEYMGRFEGRKEKGEMYSYYNLKTKNK